MQLIGTGKQRAGKTARVLVNTLALAFASWKITFRGDDLDTGNFESFNVVSLASFNEGILGFIGCDWNCGGDWDAGVNPLGSPPGLYPRDDLTLLQMYESRIDVTLWAFPYARVRSSENGAEAKGKVTFNSSGMNQGPFTYPAGSV